MSKLYAPYRSAHIGFILRKLAVSNNVGKVPHSAERGPPLGDVLYKQTVCKMPQGYNPCRLQNLDLSPKQTHMIVKIIW